MIQCLPKYLLLLACAFLIQAAPVSAQDGSALPSEKEEEGPKLRFNGLGRTILAQTGVGGPLAANDTSTIKNLTDGEFLLDLALNATPNKVSEVQAILRLRNEFGGFFGAGMSVEVRELWARGIIANTLRYRVGDMDKVMTPYTLFNYDEEGFVNEPTVFQPQRDVIHYEQFYTDRNTRRLQGASLDFGLSFAQFLEDVDVNGFIARIRGTDFFTVPTRFITGGQAHFTTQAVRDTAGLMANFGLNYVHTFDDLQSGEATSGIRNSVYSLNFDVRVLDSDQFALHLLGETGRSDLNSKSDSLILFEESDSFLDVGAKIQLKSQNLSVTASFIDNGPDFFSIGAQSKRIDFDAEKSYYNRLGKDDVVRDPTLFDITRDRSLYTFQLSDRLMDYDPRFSNTLPYGDATPNRRGIRLKAAYTSNNEFLEAGINSAFLSEIRGQGTPELKQFSLLRASANLNINKALNWEKLLRISLGYQYESIARDGLDVEQVDLTSNLLEVGLDAELFTNFELLLGAKMLSAEGRDYVPRIDMFNEVADFPAVFNAMGSENLLAAGIKYQFKEGIYLTIQYQSFQKQDELTPDLDYNFSQVFVLYNMNF
ncbi:MAG: hypothetical protein GYB31_00200 [Bacteroidetes bacterium]|nr:hypothetical protein [Bacteroidota bacterium]